MSEVDFHRGRFIRFSAPSVWTSLRGLCFQSSRRRVHGERRVATGETIAEPLLVAELRDAPRDRDLLARLTARERDVLALMAQGRTDRGISEELFVTRKTVETHVRSILRKLDLPQDAGENRRVHAVLRYLCAFTPSADNRSPG